MSLRPLPRLLLPALLAVTAWAQAAAASGAAGAPETKAPAVKKYEFDRELVVVPSYWKSGEKTKTLIRAEFYYNWDKPDRECTTDAYPWAYVVVSNDISPCWNPDPEYFEVVRQMEIAGTAGTMYRHKKVATAADSDSESCPGQSYMALVFSAKGRCYNIKFITREKYVKQFFPDFKIIIDNFQVLEPRKADRKKGPALREDGILP